MIARENDSLSTRKSDRHMECEFISKVETWGSGDQMLDILTLKDGKVPLITADAITLFDDRSAFESGITAATLSR